MIKDIVKKLLFDKQELTPQEREDLLRFFEYNEPDNSIKLYSNDVEIMSGEFVQEDLTSQINGTTSTFNLSYQANAKVTVFCNLQQQPGSIVMDSDMRGFSLSFTPTTNDKLIVEYYK